MFHQESHIDNYQTWLPMYPNSADPNDTVVKQPGGPFDGVVEKMTTAIQEHSITAKPRRDPVQPNTQEYRDWLRQNEFNPFIDRAWILMGKAHVQNKDYTEAVSVLSHTGCGFRSADLDDASLCRNGLVLGCGKPRIHTAGAKITPKTVR